MKLIIDAYNILKQVASNLYITHAERAKFIRQVVAYADKKNIDIVVVFDGAPSDDQSSIEHRHRVTIVYAGHATQADAFIQKYVATYKERELLLVSTDRALCRWVARYHVQSIDALAFYTILQQTQRVESQKQQVDGKSIKFDNNSPLDLDALMEEACQQIEVKDSGEYEDSADRLSRAYTPSKKERALSKKIKKL